MDEAVGAAALRWLSQDDHIAKHNHITSRRVPGVSEKLTGSAQFRSWLANKQQVLLCLGGPGTGKTTITSMVVDTLFENFGKDPTIGIAFVYPGPKKRDRSLGNLVRSMLLQLGQRSPSVPSALVDLHSRSNDNASPPSIQDLFDVLSNIVSKMSKVYLVIDSLDEIPIAHRRVILPELHKLQKSLPFSLLATSELEIKGLQGFDRLPTLNIFNTIAEYDLDAYVSREICRLAPEVQGGSVFSEDPIRDKVRKASEGL
jgi:Cdc6-like AAA superfamily ATPase